MSPIIILIGANGVGKSLTLFPLETIDHHSGRWHGRGIRQKILAPELSSKGIYTLDCFKIKHTKGRLTNYSHLKKDLLNALYESDSIVTTLID